jgi:hypothetical protein
MNGLDGRMIPLNENDIYRKQEKRFNIITLKPKEHEQSLHQYPKFTLEDRD